MSLPPRSLNVLRLANARAPEVGALYSILKKRICKRKRKDAEPGNTDFAVPRNQRRRTTSFLNRKANFWKKRKRDFCMRANRSETRTTGASGPSVEDEGPKKLKKLCRRARRRIELKGGRDGGFGISGDGTRRLVTHVWHAKRFTMVKKWGYYLPLGVSGRGRGSRAVLKWAKSSALLHDASYYSAVQLEGIEDSILKVLRMLLEPSPPSVAFMSEMSRAELYGVCYGTAMLHRLGECPYGSIAPITYLWRPSFRITSAATAVTDTEDRCAFPDKEKEQANQTRHLWIWVHAAAFDDAFDALQSACQRQNEEDGTQLKCLPRRGELGRVDVLGSRALQLLQRILHPLSRFHDLVKAFKLEGSLDLDQSSACQISQVSEAYLLAEADKLPDNAVLAMEVCDPRDAPAKQCKFFPQVDSTIQDDQTVPAVAHKIESRVTDVPSGMQLLGKNGNEEPANLLENRFSIAASQEEFEKPIQEDSSSYWLKQINRCNTFATFMGNKALWSSQSEGFSIESPMSENVLSMKRHQQRLAFFHLDGGNAENAMVERGQTGYRRSCPILLLKHHNQKPSVSGWSIILPISWVRAFWMPLVLAGAHVIGLRERRWLSSSAGLPFFPFDFPDCKAYGCYMNEEAAAYEEMIARRPPSKRPPPILLPTPWNCIKRPAKIGCIERTDPVGSVEETEAEKSGSVNVHNIDLVDSLCNEFEILEGTTDFGSHNSLSVENAYSCFPGFIARTSEMLKQHLKRNGGLHLLLFPEINRREKKDFFHLMDEGRLGWSLRGINNLIVESDPCFLRVLLYAPRKGVFEEGAIVCAPMQKDFSAWLSRSQRWQGLEIPPTLRNADCIRQQMSSGDVMQLVNTASVHGQDNLRRPIGFVTTGACRGSIPAVAIAMCEGTILGQLRAEQWREEKWKRKCEIFVLVRNMKSTIYRPALAAIVLEEFQDVISS